MKQKHNNFEMQHHSELQLKDVEIQLKIEEINKLIEDNSNLKKIINEPLPQVYKNKLNELNKEKLEMKEEIELLIKRCKENDSKLKLKTERVKELIIVIDELEKESRKKDDLITRQESCLTRYSRQINPQPKSEIAKLKESISVKPIEKTKESKIVDRIANSKDKDLTLLLKELKKPRCESIETTFNTNNTIPQIIEKSTFTTKQNRKVILPLINRSEKTRHNGIIYNTKDPNQSIRLTNCSSKIIHEIPKKHTSTGYHSELLTGREILNLLGPQKINGDESKFEPIRKVKFKKLNN